MKYKIKFNNNYYLYRLKYASKRRGHACTSFEPDFEVWPLYPFILDNTYGCEETIKEYKGNEKFTLLEARNYIKYVLYITRNVGNSINIYNYTIEIVK